MVAVARKLLHHLLPGVIRPLHALWNQIIGFFFIVLAILPVPSAVKSYGEPGSWPRLALTIPFVVLMATFGISSFLKARRISRT